MNFLHTRDVPTSARFLVQGDHFVHCLLGSKAFALIFLNLLRVAAALGNEIIEVEHVETRGLED